MRHRNDLMQIHSRFFNPGKSPGGTPNVLGMLNYTASERTIDRRFSRNRTSLLWNPKKQGTFIGNVRKTFGL